MTSTDTEPTGSRSRPLLYSSVLLILGAVLIFGGGWLFMIGGSSYYLLMGLTISVSAVLLWRHDRRGVWLYGMALLATLTWAVYEVGFDTWALAPRLIGPFALGLGLFTPSVRRSLPNRKAPSHGIATLWLPLGAGLAAIAIGALLHALTPQPPDPIYQAGVTERFPAVARDAGSVPMDGDWSEYGGNDAGQRHFSQLTQVGPGNVGRLQVAWTFRTGLAPTGVIANFETTPLKVGNRLYLCTGYNDVISLDAETGQQKWRFVAQIGPKIHLQTCRGVAYYAVPRGKGECAARIITATADARLMALDAETGHPCSGFGTNGTVSLLTGLGSAAAGEYFITSAPTLVRGKIVVGGKVLDNQYWGEPSGVIRAFDAVTGSFDWAFDMGRPDRREAPAANEVYTPSTPNSWAPMSADESLGLVYAPTGNTSGADHYGAQRRPFDDKYNSSVVALDVSTGQVRWSYQTVHHDLWDYDVASAPALVDLQTSQGVRQALIEPTKRGEVFILDRVTGRPLTPIEERPAPTAGAASGERPAATQPFPVGIPSFRGRDLRERDMWGLTPLDQLWCRIAYKRAYYAGIFSLPSLTGTLEYPGYAGGANWGGVSIDPERQYLVLNVNHLANYVRLLTRAEADRRHITPAGGELAPFQTQANTPYGLELHPFMSPLNVPCQEPPYSTLAAVDLTTRKLIWSRSIGTARDSGPFGLSSLLPILLGTPAMGGSLVTRSGLIFISATQELALHALDARNGRELWTARLPAGGQATPMTYWSSASNRQFVVIAAGGSLALQTKRSDYLVAYALPKDVIQSPPNL